MKLTPEKKVAFLAALANTCSVTAACKAVAISRMTAYEWRDEDEEFAEAWQVAKRVGAEALEDEAVRRAHVGVDKPVFWQGMAVDTVKEYSDLLIMFLLKGAMPEKYREKSSVELTGANGGPVDVTDTQAAARLAALLASARARRDADQPGGDS